MRVPEQVKRVAAAVEAAGGRAMLVGGAVADLRAGREPADWDVEVYGLDAERLTAALAPFDPKRVGRCHEVFQFAVEGVDIDVNLPVRSNGAGLGEADPSMSPKEAARRRDFSFNAMFMDILSDEVFDHFGGRADLEAGVLRHTDAETFVEDPIRGLRAMQLCARKAPHLAPETAELLRSMAVDLDLWSLPRERIHEEWRKLVLKAAEPSLGLRVLVETDWIKFFPELGALIGVEQNPKYHPEGDAFVHTLRVFDEAAKERDDIEDGKEREAFMWAALGHDYGKATETQEDLSAPGHDRASGPLLRSFLERLTNCERKVIGPAVKLAENHMRPRGLHDGHARPSRWKVLADAIAPATLNHIGRLSVADWRGSRDAGVRTARVHEVSEMCFQFHKELASKHGDVKAILDGRKLIAAGHKPGPGFREALEAALHAQVDGEVDEGALLDIAVAELRKVRGGGA